MAPQGAPKDALGDFIAGAQVAASNQTLNAWMGGRQPAWMTSTIRDPQTTPTLPSRPPTPRNPQGGNGRIGRPPVRPQGWPPRYTTNIARLPHQLTAQPFFALPDQAGAASEPGKQTLDCAAALPSPAPTDQPSPPTATVNQPQNQTRESENPDPEPIRNTLEQVNSAQVGVGRTFSRHQHPQEPARPVVGTAVATQAGPAAPAPFAYDYATSRFIPGETNNSPMASPNLQNRMTNLSPALQNAGAPQGMPRVRSASAMSPTGAHGSPAVNNQSRPSTSGGTQAAAHDLERRDGEANAAANPNLDCLRPDTMSRVIDVIIARCGGTLNAPPDNTTAPRLRLLKDAVHTRDYFYIALHQILCVWSFNKEAVRRALRLDAHLVDTGLQIVQTILRKNSNMNQAHVKMFALFPSEPNDTFWGSCFYSNFIKSVGSFLTSIHLHWNQTIIPSMKPDTGRRCPMLVEEIRTLLGTRSPVLEPIIFTVTRRHMGIADGAMADSMTQLFYLDLQTDYTTMSPQDQTNAKNMLIDRYRQLVAQYRSVHPVTTSRPSDSLPAAMPQMMPQTMPQMVQHTALPGQHMARRHSAGYPAIQPIHTQHQFLDQTAHGPGFEGFSMYPSPAFQQSPPFSNNTPPLPPQHLQRNNYQTLSNGGAQAPISRAPTAQMGPFNQPLTPAGSPHYTNVQLPNAGRMSRVSGQVPLVSHALNGGSSVSMPTAILPTQSTAGQDLQRRGSLGQPLPSTEAGVHQVLQRDPGPPGIPQPDIHVDHARQTNMIADQEIALATARPKAHPASHAAPGQGSSREEPPATNSSRRSNPPNPRSSLVRPRHRETPGISRGAFFRPADQQISLDRMPHSPWESKALAMALHQADVRSPRRVPRELPDGHTTVERHYQAIRSLAAGPVATRPCYELHRLAFTVSDEDFDKVCPKWVPIGEQIPASQYFNGALRYRLRLCELPVSQPSDQTVSEFTWAVGQTHWPKHISVVMNGQVMKIRRKQHNGQHLPVELTWHLRRGVNNISVGINPVAGAQETNTVYYMAVEVIETLRHQSVIDMVMAQGVITASSTREAIRKRLEPGPAANGDEVTVVGNELSIDLADPFSSTIFEVPVRGAACTHMECFDLMNWLLTRPSKPRCTIHGMGDKCRICRGPDLGPEPTLVDKWKCPLCGGDARPYSLQVDKFLEEVRTKLEMEGNLRTKTIHVSADGSWRSKTEEASNHDDESDEVDGPPPAKRAKTAPLPSSEAANAVEIIELD